MATVTIELSGEQEEHLRAGWLGGEPVNKWAGTSNQIMQLVRNALPDPPYVPKVGHVVTIQGFTGEKVLYVNDEVVLTVDPQGGYTTWMLDHHTFERVL